MKYIPHMAFVIAIARKDRDPPRKPLGKNSVKALEKRHITLASRRVKAMDWDRQHNNTYDKVVYWFEVIKKVLDGSVHCSL